MKWTIRSIYENIKLLKSTKTKHPNIINELIVFWKNELKKIKIENMYKRNQLIFAQKRFNADLEKDPMLLKSKAVTDLDKAIEQIDYLLSLIKTNK